MNKDFAAFSEDKLEVLQKSFVVRYGVATSPEASMQYEQAQDLQPQEFKRLYGVQPQTFKQMVEVMREHTQHKKKSGCPKLSLEDQVLVALQYWREYRTTLSYCSRLASFGVHCLPSCP